MDKASLRKKLIKARLELDEASYNNKSKQIIKQLKQLDLFKQAQRIGLYASFKHEVDTIELIKEVVKKKDVCLPKVVDHRLQFYQINSLTDLKKGYQGILEPCQGQIITKDEIDLLIVPMVGYDEEGNRLGYGGGFYDRYLKDYPNKTIGIAFKLQKVPSLVVRNYDISLEIIIDEDKVNYFYKD